MALPPYLLVKLLLVRYSIACLRLFIVYYKIYIYIVYRDFITKLIIGVLSFTTTPTSTCSLAFVSEIQKCLPEAVCCYNYNKYIVDIHTYLHSTHLQILQRIATVMIMALY